MADSTNNSTAAGIASAGSNATNRDRVVVDALILNNPLWDIPLIHHSQEELANAVAHILTDLGPGSTPEDLVEQLTQISTVCSEAIASLDQAEHSVSQEITNAIANLLRPINQDVHFEEKIGLLKVIRTASSRAIEVLADEKAQYLRNMRIFYQVLHQELRELQMIHESLDVVASIIGDGVLQTSNKLWFLARDLPEERFHDKYLVDIQRYWRRFTGKEGAKGFEDGWVYLADCDLTWDG